RRPLLRTGGHFPRVARRAQPRPTRPRGGHLPPPRERRDHRGRGLLGSGIRPAEFRPPGTDALRGDSGNGRSGGYPQVVTFASKNLVLGIPYSLSFLVGSSERRMNTAVQRFEDEVRQLVRQRGVDPQRDPEGAKNLIGEVITDYDLRSLRGSVPRLEDVDTVAKTLHDLIIRFGPLQPLL